MSLLTPAVLAVSPQGTLDRAEALVANHICPALPDLTLRTWVAQYGIRNDQRAYGLPLYGKRRLGPEVLRYWPVTGLTSITQDGVDLFADCTFDRFAIRRDALAPEFLALGVVTVTFQTGWANAAALPAEIAQAIILTAQGIDATPLGIQSEKLGDASTVYRAQVRGITPDAAALLAPWRYVGS